MSVRFLRGLFVRSFVCLFVHLLLFDVSAGSMGRFMIDLSDPNGENGLLDMDEARAMKVLWGSSGVKGTSVTTRCYEMWRG